MPAATIGADYYRFDESTHAMRGERTGETYRLGDQVEVKLVEAAPVAGALRFELLSEGRYSGKGGVGRRRARPGEAAQRRRTSPTQGEGRTTPRVKDERANAAPGEAPWTTRRGCPRPAPPTAAPSRARCHGAWARLPGPLPGLRRKAGCSAASSRSPTPARPAATEFHHHRADDLPPYLVIFIVGHLVGYGILTAETRFEVPLWLHLAVWPALTLVLCLALLQPVKGAVVGLQYALGMHGFGGRRAARAADGRRRVTDTRAQEHARIASPRRSATARFAERPPEGRRDPDHHRPDRPRPRRC